MTKEVPAWFERALADVADAGAVDVRGARVAYRAWGAADRPGVVLVHGGAAHSGWWDHIAPLLSADLRVVALDLSGHGDSDRRPGYSLDLWAEEIRRVAAASGISGPPVVVGHSMGGAVALRAAMSFGPDLEGVVVIDSPIRDITPEERAAREHRAFGPLRTYASRDEAIGRFRTIPEQAATLPYVIAHVAAASVLRTPAGWTWKFDPRIFDRPPLTPDVLTELDCRVALFRAELGMLSAEMSDVLYDRLGRRAPVIEIPDAGHHIMLDQPLALVTGLRTLLADWAHSRPM